MKHHVSKTQKVKQNLSVIGLLVLVTFITSCQPVSANPKEWSHGQATTLKAYYTARQALNVKQFYKLHEARQVCTNLKQWADDWKPCISWITGDFK